MCMCDQTENVKLVYILHIFPDKLQGPELFQVGGG